MKHTQLSIANKTITKLEDNSKLILKIYTLIHIKTTKHYTN